MRLYESTTQSWRARWVQAGKGKSLHRLARFDAPDDDWFEDRGFAGGKGLTVCGIEGEVHMPGIFSRLGASRCARCCKAIGIPTGKGVPFNDESIDPAHPEKNWSELPEVPT